MGTNELFPEANISNILNQISDIEIRDYTLADYQHEIIMENIKDFEENLDDKHEVALRLTSFGQNILLNVTDIGYSNPCLIHYYGYVNGNYSELTQHISQINFLLTSVPNDNPNRKARRIGFYPNDDDNQTSSTSDNN